MGGKNSNKKVSQKPKKTKNERETPDISSPTPEPTLATTPPVAIPVRAFGQTESFSTPDGKGLFTTEVYCLSTAALPDFSLGNSSRAPTQENKGHKPKNSPQPTKESQQSTTDALSVIRPQSGTLARTPALVSENSNVEAVVVNDSVTRGPAIDKDTRCNLSACIDSRKEIKALNKLIKKMKDGDKVLELFAESQGKTKKIQDLSLAAVKKDGLVRETERLNAVYIADLQKRKEDHILALQGAKTEYNERIATLSMLIEAKDAAAAAQQELIAQLKLDSDDQLKAQKVLLQTSEDAVVTLQAEKEALNLKYEEQSATLNVLKDQFEENTRALEETTVEQQNLRTSLQLAQEQIENRNTDIERLKRKLKDLKGFSIAESPAGSETGLVMETKNLKELEDVQQTTTAIAPKKVKGMTKWKSVPLQMLRFIGLLLLFIMLVDSCSPISAVQNITGLATSANVYITHLSLHLISRSSPIPAPALADPTRCLAIDKPSAFTQLSFGLDENAWCVAGSNSTMDAEELLMVTPATQLVAILDERPLVDFQHNSTQDKKRNGIPLEPAGKTIIQCVAHSITGGTFTTDALWFIETWWLKSAYAAFHDGRCRQKDYYEVFSEHESDCDGRGLWWWIAISLGFPGYW